MCPKLHSPPFESLKLFTKTIFAAIFQGAHLTLVNSDTYSIIFKIASCSHSRKRSIDCFLYVPRAVNINIVKSSADVFYEAYNGFTDNEGTKIMWQNTEHFNIYLAPIS